MAPQFTPAPHSSSNYTAIKHKSLTIQLVTPLLLCPGLKLPIKLLSILSSLRLDTTGALWAKGAISRPLGGGPAEARAAGLAEPWRTQPPKEDPPPTPSWHPNALPQLRAPTWGRQRIIAQVPTELVAAGEGGAPARPVLSWAAPPVWASVKTHPFHVPGSQCQVNLRR